MKANTLSQYHVFLASPGDVDDERQAVREFFGTFNITNGKSLNTHFTVVDWENYANVGVGRPQELITEQTLAKYKDSLALVIGVMAQKFGSPTGKADSGTEEEFNWALKSNIETGFPEIKWFFKLIDSFSSPADHSSIENAFEQWKKVGKFKESMRTSDPPVFYNSYKGLEDFKTVFSKDLTLWLLDENRPWATQSDAKPIKNTRASLSKIPENYYSTIESAFRSLDIRGIDNDKAVDIPLTDVYVRLRVIRDESAAEESSKNEESYTDLDIHDALSRYSKLVIVGDPGSGKSTFLKYIALILAQAHLRDNSADAVKKLSLLEPLPIPIFISLWDLSDYLRKRTEVSDISCIPNFIQMRFMESGADMSIEFIVNLLSLGNCCLLFDGLDEVPTDVGRSLISKLLEQFVSNYPLNRFVVTSRIRGYTGDSILKNEFIRCDIQDFNENDRAEFLKNWFALLTRSSDQGEKECFELRRSIEANDRIRSLAVNPLLMTVIAIVHWNRKRLPDQRVDLYDECVDVLLGQRKVAERGSSGLLADALHATKQDEIIFNRTWTRKRFAEIALLILQSGEDSEITRDSVVKLLVPRFIDRGAQNQEVAEHEATSFLDSQELSSGLLISRKSRSCRFVHLTFQEYLSAWHLANQNLEIVKTTVKPHIRDSQWFETLQLLGGEMAKKSDENLSEFIDFILEHLGKSVGEQATLIALCANILSDIKGVADINSVVQTRYEVALAGTLEAFHVDSGVPVKTQLEVLGALAKLGSSVKDHLIAATRSGYFKVRSTAINLLIEHLSEEGLFEMSHILSDRSQEPVWTYVQALFQRNAKRAKELIVKQATYTSRQIKSLAWIMDNHLGLFSTEEIARIVDRSLQEFGLWNSHYIQMIKRMYTRPTVKGPVKEVAKKAILTSKSFKVSSAIQFLAMMHGDDLDTWKLISRRALAEDASFGQWSALHQVSLHPERFVGSWTKIYNLAKESKDYSVMWAALRALYAGKKVHKLDNPITAVALSSSRVKTRTVAMSFLIQAQMSNNKKNSVAFDDRLLYTNLIGNGSYIDPLTPISRERIAFCSKKLGFSEEEIIDKFKVLIGLFPVRFANGVA